MPTTPTTRETLIKWLEWAVPIALPLVVGAVGILVPKEQLEAWVAATLRLQLWAFFLIIALLTVVGFVWAARAETKRKQKAAEEEAAAEAAAQAEAKRAAQEKAQREAQAAQEEAAKQREAEWQAWRGAFRQACPARDLDAQAIMGPTRPMGQPFEDGPRLFTRPITFQLQPETESTFPAADYLRDQILGRDRLGLLLQGPPLLGKTRFLVEWLRREHPEMYVLVPDSGRDIPAPHDDLADHLAHGCCLLLDDVDNFDDRTRDLQALLDGLHAHTTRAGSRLLVLATLRDAEYGAKVDGQTDFKALREGLDRMVMVAPSHDLLEGAAEAAGKDLKPRGERERTFSFQLGREFEIMGIRYRALAESGQENERHAVLWLKAAKLLEDRTISLTPDRIQAVAVGLFNASPERFEAARFLLQTEGFRDHRALEPAYLKHVVPDPAAHDADLLDRLETTLQDRRDAEALRVWGLSLTKREQHLTRAERLLRAAATTSREAGAHLTQAKAHADLSVLLWKRKRMSEAEIACKHAVEAGTEAPPPEGLIQVARALFNLGYLLAERGKADEAGAAYERATEAGAEAGTPEGEEVVRRARHILATLRDAAPTPEPPFAPPAHKLPLPQEEATPPPQEDLPPDTKASLPPDEVSPQ